MQKNLRITLFMLFIVTIVFGQNENNFYKPPTSFKIIKNLRTDYNVDNNFNTDDSKALQKAIDEVSAAGGGKIILPAANYSFIEIHMKSNVHIEIDKDAVIRPAKPNKDKNYGMFCVGEFKLTSPGHFKNMSIVGKGGKVTVDLSQTSFKKVWVFMVRNADNFKIANFHVKDARTKFSAIGFCIAKYQEKDFFGPKNGVIKNCSIENAHYGYGMVQCGAGENLLFKNLEDEGGLTLRLESGWEYIQTIKPASKIPKIKNVYGRNLKCTNGQAALMLSPHTIKQGFVDIRNITTISCEWGVKIEGGFTNKKQAEQGLTPGYFSESSIIADVKSTFGTDGKGRSQFLRFIPCSERGSIGQASAIEHNSRPAPSCAAIGDFGSEGKGKYQVKIWNVRPTGYANTVPAIVNSNYDDYPACAPVNGFKVWIPKDTWGTDAPRLNVSTFNAPPSIKQGSTATLSINYTAEADGEIYFALMNKSTGMVITSKKVSVTRGNGTKSTSLTVPSTLEVGNYLWKANINTKNKRIEDDQRYADVAVTIKGNGNSNNDIVSIDGPLAIQPNQNTSIKVKYTASQKVDIYVQLIQKSPWITRVSKKTTINAGTNTSNFSITIPSDAPAGNYIWRAWMTPEGKGWSERIDDVKLHPILSTSRKASISGSSESINNQIKVYPLPFGDVLNVSLSEQHEFSLLQIIDITGKVVFSQSISENKDVTISSDKLDSIKSGAYILKLQGGSQIEIIRLLKY